MRGCIAIKINDDQLSPIININEGSKNFQSKIIKMNSSIKIINIFYVDFEKKQTKILNTIDFPEALINVVLNITYDKERNIGKLIFDINNNQYVWDYNVSTNRIEGEIDNGNIITTNDNTILNDDIIVDRARIKKIKETAGKAKEIDSKTLFSKLSKDIFGQDEAIKKVSDAIVSNLKRKHKEILPIVLFGKTGVGKSQLAKNTSKALSELMDVNYGLKEVSLNEFKDDASMTRFFGAAPGYVGFGQETIFQPIIENKNHVLLLDEIEKASPKIWTSIMQILENSSVTLANNQFVDLSSTILIITTNLDIDLDKYNSLSNFKKDKMCRDKITDTCGHPEVAGRMYNFIVFKELDSDAIENIIIKFFKSELEEYDMQLKQIDEHLIVEFEKAYEGYGARDVKGLIKNGLSTTVANEDITKYKNRKVKLSGNLDKLEISLMDNI